MKVCSCISLYGSHYMKVECVSGAVEYAAQECTCKWQRKKVDENQLGPALIWRTTFLSLCQTFQNFRISEIVNPSFHEKPNADSCINVLTLPLGPGLHNQLPVEQQQRFPQTQEYTHHLCLWSPTVQRKVFNVHVLYMNNTILW